MCVAVADVRAFLPTIVMDEVEVKHHFVVIMDVGYYIHILDQNDIKIVQDSSADDPYRTYSGCATREFLVNFPADVSATIDKAAGSAAGGEWSVTLAAPGGSAATQVSIPRGITPVDISAYRVAKSSLRPLREGLRTFTWPTSRSTSLRRACPPVDQFALPLGFLGGVLRGLFFLEEELTPPRGLWLYSGADSTHKNGSGISIRRGMN